ncbi:pentapeptide repeat-containing protein [Anabaena cylindrica FACHB-243]|uniref:Pentapeptide repeat protein n=1 Tax=Anabaena cylindrica (strain ATCC 27899 / PCC 7122) TaxID=272123 RepID=K9ZE79_ANACC|nr:MULTISPECIES: pentapeptide repeat-containing protein [Anabaena]AFZ57491.1 pentapeptide repeat protein [Anabaena cylindrica PCC 7122]MBD2421175.1 pentapeptide repeat-containing protein [Anabaena cylindrica FACHB-243]MBY5281727.1 NACHT domain-containing protein [Anabaena sp. CCAP 1446/1C]MBY5310318.1 NACHT domain-containing protein [Anabaena sp. CCAP 1446/1C]MCM2405933.1 pentapeptide repeat-containing protein [Anabaena sp. CCAP 1446/1C]
MKKHLSQIWHQFQQSFSVEKNLNTTIETGQAVIEATAGIQKQGVSLETLKSVLQNSSSLLDVFCLPLAQIIDSEFSFLSLGIALLKFYGDISPGNLTLEDCVSIISQAAYLESTKEILSLYPAITEDTNADNLPEVSKKLINIHRLELDDQSATDTIFCFHESQLATAFNQILSARLIAPDVTKYLANLLTKRIAANTQRYMIQAFINLGAVIENIIHIDLIYWQQAQANIHSIDEYLDKYITSPALETVFQQGYSIQDIYIPLQAKSQNLNSDILDLETWTKGMLLNPNKLSQLILIQGQTGRGKSTFARIFANWVKTHLYPLWTPILIDLKNLNTISMELEDTLKSALPFNFSQADNWLQNTNYRFFFILDGLDELNSDIVTQLNLSQFMQQLGTFQQKCKSNALMGHRVLITSHNNALKTISNLPENLEQVEIIALNETLQEKWLQKWAALPVNQGKNTDFQQFLQPKKLPSSLQILAHEPLLLHLLAAMYRDSQLTVDQLERAKQKTAKTFIYHKAINWLITPYLHHNDLNSQKVIAFKAILTAAANCVVQSGGNFTSMLMLETYLQEDQKTQDIIAQQDSQFLKTSLVACGVFANDSRFEFFHGSFRDFLFAERFKEILIAWTQKIEDTQEPVVSETDMNWQIYDLLGFGKITSEIIEFLVQLLIEVPNFDWVMLFQRLENFYNNWCQKQFINDSENNLPQIKLQQLQKYGIHHLDQTQVDVYTGLNLMIFLLELHRYAQGHDVLKENIIFYPSGQPQSDVDTTQLRDIINYSNCLSGENFNQIVGSFLSGTNLRGADLSEVDFGGANLSHADLSRANLNCANFSRTNCSGAYMISANFSEALFNHANLHEANFIRANLTGADLSSADLNYADLSLADLSGANLSGANLEDANFSGAKLSNGLLGDICWDEKTSWKNVEGLEIAKNLPVELKQQLKIF